MVSKSAFPAKSFSFITTHVPSPFFFTSISPTIMGKPSSPREIVPPEEDPNSELNLLRREVRQLQAAVRDAALQVATHQEDAITLRKSLASTEADLEDSLARENNLRLQLDTQRLKKEHIESTMAAAEALVDSLREMVLEPHPTPAHPPTDIPLPPTTAQTSGPDDLDILLSRISDNVDSANPDGPPEPKLVSTLDRERPPDAHVLAAPDLRSPPSDLHKDPIVGDTASPIDSPLLASQRPLDDSVLTDPTFLPPLRNPPSPPLRNRHSMPVSRSPRVSPAQARHPSNLLLSAFGTGNASGTSQGTAIRSSVSQLPVEIATLAKAEEAMRRSTQTLPSGVRSAVSDAHSGEIYAIASSGDGKWVASAGDDKVIKVYDSMGNVFGSISELTRSVTALAFSPDVHLQGTDQSIIYAGSTDGSVRSFRRQAKRRPKWTLASVYPVHSQTVRKMILTDSNGVSTNSPRMILSCSTDRTIKVSDIENSGRGLSVTTPSVVLDVDTFGANGGGMVVSGHKDGGIRLWSTQEAMSNIAGAKVHSKAVVSVCCVDDGHGIVSLGRDNTLRLCDIRNGVGVIGELEGVVETVSDWHRAEVDGRHVACGIGRSGELGIWNVDSRKILRKVSCVSESSDDVLDMVARKLRSPGCIVAPHWTAAKQFVCGHRTRQVSFWDSM